MRGEVFPFGTSRTHVVVDTALARAARQVIHVTDLIDFCPLGSTGGHDVNFVSG